MALLTGEPRSATVSAIRDTELVMLTKTAFEQLVEREPRVMLEMARLLIERYQRMLQPTTVTRPVTLALVPCHPDLPIVDVASKLVEALSPGRQVLWLNLPRLDASAAPRPACQSISRARPWPAGCMNRSASTTS